ncbi:hypothetical protein Plav_1904 [Parvibaculum lavamentivorans DS-1]|uniref:Uncharacterized protein n=1 Tax=Parvibaculum lavamentivorans (strain DS-1 / DSM 13023 / NCIMB 13966) TaxID=402881 RepID=A7HUD6_PARL1|nr:hypothetical protein [Parvibaculum lavamentivorans]ABS63519.1 hypothetical protein Plav_1904 [Parvibaculum lavamentivorans DS-1]
MMKNFFAAAVLAFGLALAPAMLAVSPAAAQGSVEMQAEVEALILANQDDEAALELAISTYITSAEDPELATQAVIAALVNSQNPELVQLLIEKPGLKLAAGRGIGAAIAIVALTNPTAAENMLALVQASGDQTLIAAVVEGRDAQTASLVGRGVDTGADVLEGEESTPEEAASGN